MKTKKRIDKKYLWSLIGLLLFLLLFSIGRLKSILEERSIENNTFTSLAKVTKTVSKRMSNKIYYQYFFRGEIYNDFEEVKEINIGRFLNKYYEVEISTKKPSYSRIRLQKEMTDTLKIKAAGFDIE